MKLDPRTEELGCEGTAPARPLLRLPAWRLGPDAARSIGPLGGLRHRAARAAWRWPLL